MMKRPGKLVLNVSAYALCAIWLIPIVWMMVVAFKPESVDTTQISNWFTTPFTLDNIKAVLEHPQADVFRWIANSAIISTITMVGMLLICIMAAFAFAKINIPGKNLLFVLVMIGMMVPREATLIPLYLQFQEAGLLNSYFSLIAPSLAAPFAVIVLRTFFSSLPDSLFEAAKIDGCGWFRMCFGIAVPLSKSAISSLGVLLFLQSWNDFLWPFISITEKSLVTIPVGLPVFRSQYLTGQGITMAAGALLAIPIIIVFIVLQKHIVKGIASTGIKG